MVRDRTAALRAASNLVNGAHNIGELTNLGSRGDKSASSFSEVVIDLRKVPTNLAVFHNEVTSIQASLESLQILLDQLRRSTSSVGSPLISEKESIKSFEDLTINIQRASGRIRDNLKSMRNKIEKMTAASKLSAEYRIKDTQHTALEKRFADMMYTFFQIYSEYHEKCKNILVAQLQVMGKNTTDDEIENLLKTKDPQIFTDRLIHETKMAKQQLGALQARHQQFLNLEKSIHELRELFFCVDTLVNQQGEMVDRIEFQVSRTRDYVQKATEETAQGVIFKQKARKKKVLIYICLVVVLFIVGIAAYFGLR